MKTKRPTFSEARRPYVWHLLSPFDGKKSALFFDRKHWWRYGSEIEPVAALYELVRRHPSVGRRINNPPGVPHAAPVIIWLASSTSATMPVALRAWPDLSDGERYLWKSFAGNLKGVDCRTSEEQCESLIEAALLEIQMARYASGKKRPGLTATREGKHVRLKPENQPTAEEWEKGISASAVSAFRRGQFLIAISPDLPEEKAEKLMLQKFREHRSAVEKLQGAGKQRARPDNWLFLIDRFENAATSSSGVKSQDFNPYKKVIDSIHFK